MAAPVTNLTRVDPTGVGIKLDDYFSTKIVIEANLSLLLWDKTSQPPGFDGGDAIETTTMFNSAWRTMAPRKLKTLTPVELTCAYDPGVYGVGEMQLLINKKTTINVQFSDFSILAFFGYVRLFEPQSGEEGSQPEANVTIQPTNFDHANSVEAGPAWINGIGTDGV